MQNAESILVIINSAVLSLFLIVGIIVLILIARLVNSIKHVVDRAEEAIETAGEAAEMLRNASGPLALFKVLRNIMQTTDKPKKK